MWMIALLAWAAGGWFAYVAWTKQIPYESIGWAAGLWIVFADVRGHWCADTWWLASSCGVLFAIASGFVAQQVCWLWFARVHTWIEELFALLYVCVAVLFALHRMDDAWGRSSPLCTLAQGCEVLCTVYLAVFCSRGGVLGLSILFGCKK
jgi:hypothetical protein